MHTPRPPGRPRGQFKQKQEQLLKYLKGVEQPVSESTQDLAGRLGASTRQTERYINSLQAEKRIRVTHCRTNLGLGWANRRYIYVIE